MERDCQKKGGSYYSDQKFGNEKSTRSLGPPFTDHGPEKKQTVGCLRKLLKKFKNCDDRVTSNLLIGDETCAYMSEPQRRSDNRHWRGKNNQ